MPTTRYNPCRCCTRHNKQRVNTLYNDNLPKTVQNKELTYRNNNSKITTYNRQIKRQYMSLFPTRTEITRFNEASDIIKWREKISESLKTNDNDDAYISLENDDILSKNKVSDLFVDILQWLLPHKGLVDCEVISYVVPDFREYWDAETVEEYSDKTFPEEITSYLQINFPSGNFATFLPSGPNIVGDNYEEYFAEVNLRMRQRRLVLVLKNKDSSWECVLYHGVRVPLEFTPFNEVALKKFLF